MDASPADRTEGPRPVQTRCSQWRRLARQPRALRLWITLSTVSDTAICCVACASEQALPAPSAVAASLAAAYALSEAVTCAVVHYRGPQSGTAAIMLVLIALKQIFVLLLFCVRVEHEEWAKAGALVAVAAASAFLQHIAAILSVDILCGEVHRMLDFRVDFLLGSTASAFRRMDNMSDLYISFLLLDAAQARACVSQEHEQRCNTLAWHAAVTLTLSIIDLLVAIMLDVFGKFLGRPSRLLQRIRISLYTVSLISDVGNFSIHSQSWQAISAAHVTSEADGGRPRLSRAFSTNLRVHAALSVLLTCIIFVLNVYGLRRAMKKLSAAAEFVQRRYPAVPERPSTMLSASMPSHILKVRLSRYVSFGSQFRTSHNALHPEGTPSSATGPHQPASTSLACAVSLELSSVPSTSSLPQVHNLDVPATTSTVSAARPPVQQEVSDGAVCLVLPGQSHPPGLLMMQQQRAAAVDIQCAHSMTASSIDGSLVKGTCVRTGFPVKHLRRPSMAQSIAVLKQVNVSPPQPHLPLAMDHHIVTRMAPGNPDDFDTGKSLAPFQVHARHWSRLKLMSGASASRVWPSARTGTALQTHLENCVTEMDGAPLDGISCSVDHACDNSDSW
eukprot:jgi/Ulvmu1/8648/UM046_0053.1